MIDNDELLILLESAKSHFDFFEHVEKRYKESYGEDASIEFVKLSEIRAMGKDITLALNLLKKS